MAYTWVHRFLKPYYVCNLGALLLYLAFRRYAVHAHSVRVAMAQRMAVHYTAMQKPAPATMRTLPPQTILRGLQRHMDTTYRAESEHTTNMGASTTTKP